MEDRSKRTETVRPQFGERCEKEPECDDEDMEDGQTGFVDGSAHVRNICDPRRPTVKDHKST